MRVSDIAACHGVAISSVTKRPKSLENAGRVARESPPSDARILPISITAEGRAARESVHPARREILARAIAGTNAAQIAAFSEVLARILARLSSKQSGPR